MIKIQNDYEDKVVEVGMRVQQDFDCPNRKKFNTMFQHDKEVLELIFADPEVKKTYSYK
ncbi:MAG: hypothetical protein MJ209_03260 [archaeon]|nr:hypothetical protein [archaeon]